MPTASPGADALSPQPPPGAAEEMNAEAKAVLRRLSDARKTPQPSAKGSPVRKARRDADLSQDELSEMARISRFTLVRLEHPERYPRWSPSAETMFAVARALGKTVDELFSETVGGTPQRAAVEAAS